METLNKIITLSICYFTGHKINRFTGKNIDELFTTGTRRCKRCGYIIGLKGEMSI